MKGGLQGNTGAGEAQRYAMRCKLMHPVQRRRRGSSRTFGSRMPCGQRAGVAPCTFFSCWAKAASSITWSETRVPLGRGARVWVAVHAASSTLCAHRQGVVKRLGRVGHSGILVAQPLDRCDLGADGMSGLHLFVCMGWLLWGLAVKPRRVVKPRRECFAIKGACFFGRGDKYRQFLQESKLRAKYNLWRGERSAAHECSRPADRALLAQ